MLSHCPKVTLETVLTVLKLGSLRILIKSNKNQLSTVTLSEKLSTLGRF